MAGWMQGWCAKEARHWDHDVASSSALRSTLLANLFDESCKLQGRASCTICWDLDTFYDTIPLHKLITQGVAMRINPPRWA